MLHLHTLHQLGGYLWDACQDTLLSIALMVELTAELTRSWMTLACATTAVENWPPVPVPVGWLSCSAAAALGVLSTLVDML